MLRYKLRTLLILLAVLPPLWGVAWVKYADWRDKRQAELKRAGAESVSAAKGDSKRVGGVSSGVSADRLRLLDSAYRPATSTINSNSRPTLAFSSLSTA